MMSSSISFQKSLLFKKVPNLSIVNSDNKLAEILKLIFNSTVQLFLHTSHDTWYTVVLEIETIRCWKLEDLTDTLRI